MAIVSKAKKCVNNVSHKVRASISSESSRSVKLDIETDPDTRAKLRKGHTDIVAVSQRCKDDNRVTSVQCDREVIAADTFARDDRERWLRSMSKEGRKLWTEAMWEHDAKYARLDGPHSKESAEAPSVQEFRLVVTPPPEEVDSAEREIKSLTRETFHKGAEQAMAVAAFEARIKAGVARFVNRYGPGVGDLAVVESALREKYAADDAERVRNGEPLPHAVFPTTVLTTTGSSIHLTPERIAELDKDRLEAFLQEEYAFESVFNVLRSGRNSPAV
ncbi:hypothetical protein GLAREA_02469 [Glarea lozoyensis ATCC 20868]|uniref:Uncharacterized protein n=1 Tax=Glarea lozoyensis (strain ATCC 20868 / MF5171) TaxID=1116229 RepID=S3D3A8_GLAL2|nr:uncharacterized protein GLAREA_02469 [Glarea lozoyensis ATCC 20868]EPE26556.1 hypothetical protein GLAREA_02469 [Glarea lozoyensis ATCC 20868]